MADATLDLCRQHGGQDPIAHGEHDGRVMDELLRDAGAISERLASFAPGSEVAVVCHDRYEFTAALLGALDRQLIVALPPNARPETLKLLRSGGTVRSVLSDQDGVPGIDVRRLMGTGARPIERPVLPAARPIVVVYTSGSTGAPLPCPKSAAQLLLEAQGLARTFQISRGSSIVATVPPHHIYGLLFSVLVPLVSGASFCRETPFYADVVRRIVARDRASVLVSVPAHLRALGIMEREGTGTLTRIFSSGAPLGDETRAALAERFGWKITEVLGSSETGGIAWRDQGGAPYLVFDGIDVREGEDGRLLLRSPYLPEAAPRPFATSDRIAMVGEGTFRHLGRGDGVLKIGSTRVSIAELEERMLAVPGVKEAAVLAQAAPGGRGQETWAVVAIEAGTKLDAAKVREALRAWLDPVVLPRRFRFVEALPRESTGKLRRDALLSLFEGDKE